MQKFEGKDFTLVIRAGANPLTDSVRAACHQAEPLYETDTHVLSVSDADAGATDPNLRPVAGQLRETHVAGDYQATVEDHYLGVDASGGAITITLPALAEAKRGKEIIVKDETGSSGVNNITVTGSGSEQIDGNTSLTIGGNYDAVRLIAGDSQWGVV